MFVHLPPPVLKCLTSGPGATDATYHVMWVIVFDAVDDFGIKEMNDITRNHNPDLGSPQVPPHIDEVKVRVFDEALRGASRVAGLVGFFVSAEALMLILQNTSFRLVFWNPTGIWSVSSPGRMQCSVLNTLNRTEIRSCCYVGSLPPFRLSPCKVR